MTNSTDLQHRVITVIGISLLSQSLGEQLTKLLGRHKMIQRLLRSQLQKFERQHNYDASYMHHINQHSSSAAARLLLFSAMTDFKGANVNVWAGAALSSTLSGDCGPCAQLSIDRSIKLGVPAEGLKACLNKDWTQAKEVGLGFRFSNAVLENSDSLQPLRDEIKLEHGETTLIAASYAASCFQVYPLIKRALGYDKQCEQLQIDD